MAHSIKRRWRGFARQRDFAYAVTVIETVTWLAGRPDYLDDLREIGDRLGLAARSGRGAAARLFEWLAAMASYQGISDAVAETYMAVHGRPRWAAIAHGVKTSSCPLLGSYWDFHGCGYRKTRQTCNRPEHFGSCALPRHRFRNGNLNQLAYSLYLFIRDVAGGDLVAWIDAKLAEAAEAGEGRPKGKAIIEAMSGIHGVSSKVLGMIFSDLLLVGGDVRERWAEAGTGLIAIDTLVHNFLARTGILRRAGAGHVYGPQCYRPGGCADILTMLSGAIDARQFNPAFPAFFPRYVQRAIWAYCAADKLAVCNGRTIRDDGRCANRDCRLFSWCDRVSLARLPRKKSKNIAKTRT
jgi:hypothetical protein